MATADFPAEVEPTPTEQRQDQRLASLPEIYRQKYERLALELALGLDDADSVFERNGYTSEQAVKLIESPAFVALLQRTTEEVKSSGLGFKMKARVQAEELLGHSYEMATDPYTSGAVRADLIKWTARVAGLEPKTGEGDTKTSGGLTLSITFSGQAPQTVVTGREPVLIDQQ